jgi:hypothetical protein
MSATLNEALAIAVDLVVERIRRLPADDWRDVMTLLAEPRNASLGEELDSILITIREILEQAPLRVRRLDLTGDVPSGL